MRGANCKIIDIFWRLEDAGVLADLDPRSKSDGGYGPPSADLEPPTEPSENIILNVLVEIDNTFRFSAY